MKAAILLGGVSSNKDKLPYIQRVHLSGTTENGSQTLNFTKAGNGNLLILIISSGFVLGTLTGWNRDVGNVGNQDTGIYSKISDGTETSVTISPASANANFTCSMTLYETKDFHTFDKSSVATQSGTVGNSLIYKATSGATGATTAAVELVIAAFEWGYALADGAAFQGAPNGNYVSWDSGFRQDSYDHSTNTSLSANDDVAIGILVTSATGAQQVSVTWNNPLPLLGLSNFLIATYKP